MIIYQENDPPTYYLYYMSIVYVFNPMCAVGLHRRIFPPWYSFLIDIDMIEAYIFTL